MHEDPALDDAVRVDLLQMMVLLRTFYDAIRHEADVVGVPPAGSGRQAGGSGPRPRGGMRASLLGCEPMAAGFGVHLNSDDSVSAPRQPHYLAIARGIDLRRVVSEAIGTTHGHEPPEYDLEAEDRPVPGLQASGPSAEGAGYLPALGRAFAYQRQGSDRVAVAILGQSTATEEGFRSATHLAHTWKLPAVFLLCTDRLVAAPDADEGPATGGQSPYGIPSVCVSSVEVERACAEAGRAVDLARSGGGPSLVEVQTMWAGPTELTSPHHSAPVEDPLASYERALRDRGLVDDERMAQLRAEASYRINDAVREVVDQHLEGPDSCPLCVRKAAS
ncbi:MAG: thiamine pyrophosphate-dependent enzyme [Actinopolymorphaceae bacterium]